MELAAPFEVPRSLGYEGHPSSNLFAGCANPSLALWMARQPKPWRRLVGDSGVEPETSSLSVTRSNHLS